ncbi:MAG: hypothetical protein JWL63_514 [Rhodocyclales bacterium]|nr:hypothetical protein [Rhodocyclales bacterium]
MIARDIKARHSLTLLEPTQAFSKIVAHYLGVDLVISSQYLQPVDKIVPITEIVDMPRRGVRPNAPYNSLKQVEIPRIKNATLMHTGRISLGTIINVDMLTPQLLTTHRCAYIPRHHISKCEREKLKIVNGSNAVIGHYLVVT